jgi:hypothetical protein
MEEEAVVAVRVMGMEHVLKGCVWPFVVFSLPYLS